MKDRIYEVLKGLVACDSISGTKREISSELYVYDFLKEIPYFKKHPEQCGLLEIKNDPFRRMVPWGLVIGNKKDTVIFSGHIDVVDTQVYGEAEPLCFTIGEELEAALSKMPMNDVQRADMESGEWIWGRGTADMKGGVSIAMVLLEKYAAMAEAGELEGSVLFSAVPDEESFSAGMRAIMPKYLELREKYGLNFKLLIDPEPAAEEGPKQVLSLGTIGKTMPAIVVQGALAHTGHPFHGISALNMLSNIYAKTQGSLDFVDEFKGESSMPPAWLYMRDLKELYDVSLPFRAAGYISVLSFDTTLQQIIEQLREISKQAFEEEVAKLDAQYQGIKKINKLERMEKIYYEPCVMTVQELSAKLKEEKGEAYDKFFADLYEQASEKVAAGVPYPDATIFMMDKLMDYADIKQPYVLIGVAPPYYPPTHSDMIPGREGYGTKIYEYAKKVSEEEFGQQLTCENYFTGISDNSYTSVPDLDFDALAATYPMWGKLYSLDFEAIKEISVPSILYGPIGREYHQWTERVNKKSLLEDMPAILQKVVAYAWEN